MNYATDNRAGGTPFDQYLQQGASNRHIEARNDADKLTAGEMAKELSRELKRKILARQISYLATEWHHAGMYWNKVQKKMMGKRVYFFRVSDKQMIIDKLTPATNGN